MGEERDLLVKALRNALIHIRVFEMQKGGYTDEEMNKFSDDNVISIRDVKDENEFHSIMNIMESVGFDISEQFDINAISTLFGMDSDSMCKKMDEALADDPFFELLNEDPFLNQLMFNTVHEMIVDKDFSNGFPKELMDETIVFFGKQEEFKVCKIIKDFVDNNPKMVIENMSEQEFDNWKKENIWQLFV